MPLNNWFYILSSWCLLCKIAITNIHVCASCLVTVLSVHVTLLCLSPAVCPRLYSYNSCKGHPYSTSCTLHGHPTIYHIILYHLLLYWWMKLNWTELNFYNPMEISFYKQHAWASRVYLLGGVNHAQLEQTSHSASAIVAKEMLYQSRASAWCREVNNRLTGWAFAHPVNYFTHPVN